jgi:type IV secretion system protein TrbG
MKYTVGLFFSAVLMAQQVTNQNPFSAAAQVLRSGSPAKLPKSKVPLIQGSITREEASTVRRELVPVAAQEVLDLSRKWSSAIPALDKAGRVTFPYGEGMPVIPCALLQGTELDLEPGEEIAPDSLDIGDNRFEVAPRKAGSLSYLVIKPKAPGLDTTMIIGTNRRPYYVRLVSTQSDFVPRVAFTYPLDEQKRKIAELTRQQEQEEQSKKELELVAKSDTEGSVRNTDYSTKLKGRSAAYLRPTSVWDDGVHTYVQLSPDAKRHGLPTVQIRDATGPLTPNFRWQENRLVVDALFERACLIAGVGRRQQSACITNHELQETGHGN